MNAWSKIGEMIDAVEKEDKYYRIGTKSRRTRESLIGRIVSVLIDEPNGIKATLIAERLGVSKALVNSVIYKMEEFGICKKDGKFVWTLV